MCRAARFITLLLYRRTPDWMPFKGILIVEPAKDSFLLKRGNLKVNMLQLVEHRFGGVE